MKRIIWLIWILFLTLSSRGQREVQSIPLNFTELKVGDKMPDISLGTVLNNQTGKKRFSEFKGKLVILDFWSSNCSTCIEAFPHMALLQKEFGNKIQIFLVNPWENEEEIKIRIKKNPHWENKKDLFPVNLPLIVGAKEIGYLFPSRSGVPYHVWIDGSGIMRGRGSNINTYADKIKDLLAGKKISFIRDGAGDFDPKLPLYTVVEKTTQPVVQFNTLLSRYSDQLGGSSWGGPNIINQPDSLAGTNRNAWINVTVLGLYYTATKEMVKEKEDLIGDWRARVVLLVKDTLHYTDDRLWYPGALTDKVFRECRFSYEQITPLNLSDSLRKQFMLEDLNRYFGAIYGTDGKVEKSKVNCWLLVRTSKQDKLLHREGYNAGLVVNKEPENLYINQELNEVLKSAFFNFHRVVQNNLLSKDILINETGYTGKVDMVFPAWKQIKNMEDFRKILQTYDLDIIRGEREMKMLVVKEKY